MDFSLENLKKKLKENDTEFFYDIFNNYDRNDVKVVYDQHYGDGNEYEITLHFLKEDIYVLLDGTYSSWDSPYWNSVVEAEPYLFTKTRYKKVTKEYIRNKKLGEVLKDEE